MTEPELLIALREANGLSQEQLVEMASDGYGPLTRAAISNYERGTRQLPHDLFISLVASINLLHNRNHAKHTKLIKQVQIGAV